jgi:hypothetical protein
VCVCVCLCIMRKHVVTAITMIAYLAVCDGI